MPVLFAGYLSVGAKRLFYYFATSQRSPAKDPVVLWLNGGPGEAAASAALHMMYMQQCQRAHLTMKRNARGLFCALKQR